MTMPLWAVFLLSLFWLVLLVWINRLSYRHGIWDGAFNQTLPIVRQEMYRYDAIRAKKILGE